MTNRYEFFMKGHPRRRKPYHLKEVGLPNVYLLSGFKIENDPDYGKLVTIEGLDGLHIAIALALLLKEGPLTGPEMRYLRKQMKRTQTELAASFRVTHQTVANYEKGKTGKGESGAGPADMAIRYLYLSHIEPDKEKAAVLKHMAARIVAPVDHQPPKNLPARTQQRLSGKWAPADNMATA